MTSPIDRLFLLEREFADPAYPDARFFCRQCILVEGLLAMFPERTAALEVVRVPWPRPRRVVIDAIGEENQGLPALALREGGFISDIDALLEALRDRHGFPEPHP